MKDTFTGLWRILSRALTWSDFGKIAENSCAEWTGDSGDKNPPEETPRGSSGWEWLSGTRPGLCHSSNGCLFPGLPGQRLRRPYQGPPRSRCWNIALRDKKQEHGSARVKGLKNQQTPLRKEQCPRKGEIRARSPRRSSSPFKLPMKTSGPSSQTSR